MDKFHQYTKEMFRRRKAGARTMSFREWEDGLAEREALIAFIENEIKQMGDRHAVQQ